MKIKVHHVGGALALGMAGATLLLSTGSYAQSSIRGRKASERTAVGSSNYLEGVQRLIGEGRISGSDARFAPSAMAVLGGLEDQGSSRIGRIAFTKKQIFVGKREFVMNEEFFAISMLHSGNGAKPLRPLTASEALILRTLFAKGDFTRSRGLQLTKEGIEGELTPENAGLSTRDFQKMVDSAAAKAREASSASSSF